MEDLRRVEQARCLIRKPRLGDDVHYVLREGPRRGQHRTAKITSPQEHSPNNLIVFRDQIEDTISLGGPSFQVQSARHDEEGKQPGTWHYPEA